MKYAAQEKYRKANRKTFTLELNQKTDADIIEFLAAIDNRNGFLKKLIRDEVKKRSSNLL